MGLIIYRAKEPKGNFTIIREDLLKIMTRQIERWSTFYWDNETKKFSSALALNNNIKNTTFKVKRLAINSFNEMITLERKNRALTTFKKISPEEYHGYVAEDLLLKWKIIELDDDNQPLYSSLERNVNGQNSPLPYNFPQIRTRTIETFDVL